MGQEIWSAVDQYFDGQLLTLELEVRHAEVARANFQRAGLAGRIEILIGPALASLTRLRTQAAAPFDLVFIDADKENNLAYVQASLALSRPGTLLIVDNMVRRGAVVQEAKDAAVDAIRRMSEWIGRESRLEATVVQTVGAKGYDGFLLARVRGP
jgi:predicted O-methyltransferase YrrM